MSVIQDTSGIDTGDKTTNPGLFGRRMVLVATEFSNPRFLGDLELGDFTRQGLDLSRMHFTFETQQMDDQTPNNCWIRVYNLSDATIKRLIDRFDGVVLQAGYKNGVFGTVFAGAIRQFRSGRESNVDTYLDLLCADGDIGYNFGVIASTLSGGMSIRDAINKAAASMSMVTDKIPVQLGAGQQYIRSKVLWGMGRKVLRDAARSLDASWSIQNGAVQMTPMTGYQPGTAVVLNARTGMIGVPQLTDDGVRVRCLLNPKIRVGGLIKINNQDINQTFQQDAKDLRQFNGWTTLNRSAKINADGVYQVFVAEHRGDTRGNDWYSDLTCLSVDISKGQVKPYGG